ncbi:spore coat U domain-containing protein [Enterobacter sp. CGMCC 5087]|uniref:Csu type fimbrial protein n=1 Tax=Enterobacter sp. CGMCC 5087 TaxID=2183878 RepID=UPI0015E7FAA4|nr:spore coat U domain-containing protein [Enterobacter sp. CGMCC 5087]
MIRVSMWVAVLLLAGGAGTACAGVNCWVERVGDLNFGAVSYRTPTDAWAAVNYGCQVPWEATGAVYHIRFCHFLMADAAMPGVAPRRLRHWDGSQMAWDVYHDAARTLLTGPPGGVWPVESWTLDGASNARVTGSRILYGQVPAGQGSLSNGTYESHFNGGRLRWYWTKGSTPAPSEAACRSGSGGEGGGEVGYFLNVQAQSQSPCLIRSVTPLDFGVHVRRLVSPADGVSRIDVSCPLAVAWRMTLDNGQHGAGGARRMVNARGDALGYGLWQDAARTVPWDGNGPGVNGTGQGLSGVSTVSVYGRVPVQQAVSPGEYSDTVTVTLTY